MLKNTCLFNTIMYICCIHYITHLSVVSLHGKKKRNSYNNYLTPLLANSPDKSTLMDVRPLSFNNSTAGTLELHLPLYLLYFRN